MTDTSTAGWYPDPDPEGQIGRQRWWNGVGWSETVRQAPAPGATMTARSSQRATSQRGYPWTDQDPYRVTSTSAAGGSQTSASRPDLTAGPWGGDPPQLQAATGATRSSTAWVGWVAGGTVLAVVLAVIVFVGNGSNDPTPPVASGGPSVAQTRPPGQTRIVDEAAGVAYPYLGAYWLEFVNEVAETTSTAGQYIVTQDVVPTGGQFIAQVTSGPLQALFGYVGPLSFSSTLVAVQESVRSRYYPLPNTIETLRDEGLIIDGAEAYLLEFDLSWDVPGYDSTGERAALLLIETGRSAPALIYISIPNTHAELYGIVDRVIAEIDVLS